MGAPGDGVQILMLRRGAQRIKRPPSLPLRPRGGEGRGEGGDFQAPYGGPTHLTLPIACAMGPLPLPLNGRRGHNFIVPGLVASRAKPVPAWPACRYGEPRIPIVRRR